MDKIEINVDVITGEVTQIIMPFTEEELAKSAEMQAEETAKQEAQVSAKQSAMAKLAKLALTEVFTEVFLFWFHERIWNKVKWGKA